MNQIPKYPDVHIEVTTTDPVSFGTDSALVHFCTRVPNEQLDLFLARLNSFVGRL